VSVAGNGVMKNISFLLLFMFLALAKSHSQVEVHGVNKIETDGIQSYSLNKSLNKDFEEQIKIKPRKESSNDIEIRFYAHSILTATRDLKIIKLDKSTYRLLNSQTNI